MYRRYASLFFIVGTEDEVSLFFSRSRAATPSAAAALLSRDETRGACRRGRSADTAANHAGGHIANRVAACVSE